MDAAARMFLYLILYSVVGWVYESTLCSITQRRLVNRGFLNGPLCPIYGFGAVAVILLLPGGQDESLIKLFLSSSVLCCILEYFTSYLLEKLFHARWWDYSKRHFNLNGRVCLEGAVVFGAMAVLLVRYLHPFVAAQVAKLPRAWLYGLDAGIFVILMVDLTLTVRHLLGLKGRLAEIQKLLQAQKEAGQRRLEALGEGLRDSLAAREESARAHAERLSALLGSRRFQDRRLMRAFPGLKFRDSEAWEQLKERLRRKKQP